MLQIGGPLTPMEFEHFVRRLLEARGLKGWTTDRSGDDGVDAVAINTDPMVGGLTTVQVKEYTRVLGVNHIRELVGAMDELRPDSNREADRDMAKIRPGYTTQFGQESVLRADSTERVSF